MSEHVIIYTTPRRPYDETSSKHLTRDTALIQARSLILHQKCDVLRIEGPHPMTGEQVKNWVRDHSGV